MPLQLQHKRGLKANLPASGAAGEFFVTTDTNEISIGTGAGLSPLKIDVANITGLAASTIALNAQTGTSYSVVDGDRAKLLTLSNASPVAVALPQAGASSLFVAGWYAYIVNKGAGAVTITPTTSTINGAATLVLRTNAHVIIVSDGTNYQVFGIIPAPSTTTLGGVNSKAAVTSNFLTAIGTDGSISAAQPAFSDISGVATQAQLPTVLDLGIF